MFFIILGDRICIVFHGSCKFCITNVTVFTFIRGSLRRCSWSWSCKLGGCSPCRECVLLSFFRVQMEHLFHSLRPLGHVGLVLFHPNTLHFGCSMPGKVLLYEAHGATRTMAKSCMNFLMGSIVLLQVWIMWALMLQL